MQFATVTKDPQNPRPGQTVTVFINYNDGQGKIAAGTGTITIPVDNSRQSQTTRNNCIWSSESKRRCSNDIKLKYVFSKNSNSRKFKN